MTTEEELLQAARGDPYDLSPWLALADWLEEGGEVERAELVRLQRLLRTEMPDEERSDTEWRVRILLAEGVRPCPVTLTNSLGMRLALIPAGKFWMGSLPEESNRYAEEDPRHWVQISQPFYLGVFPVTQEEYQRVTHTNPSHFSATGAWPYAGDFDTHRFPVESVSWGDAVAFCEALSNLPEERAAGRVYRLPTEAEWEYACRGGASSEAPFHVGWSLSASQANFDGHYPCGGMEGVFRERPTPVGSFQPNGFGLYDLHGNVWEWCADWFGAAYYGRSPALDPRGPAQGSSRVQRGGSWYSYGWACRSGQRSHSDPGDRNYRSGLRVALNWQPGAKQ